MLTVGDVQLQAFLLCDNFVRDRDTGKGHIQGVFDRVYATAFPAAHGSMTIFARLRLLREPMTPPTIRLAVRAPSGMRETMPSLPMSAAPGGIVESAINLIGFPLPEPGPYTFELSIDNLVVAQCTLEAALVPRPKESNNALN